MTTTHTIRITLGWSLLLYAIASGCQRQDSKSPTAESPSLASGNASTTKDLPDLSGTTPTRPQSPQLALRVSELSPAYRQANPGYGMYSGTHYEYSITFDLMNVGSAKAGFGKLNAAWYWGDTPIGAATYVLREDDTIECVHAMGEFKEPPDVDAGRAFEIPSEYAHTFQLETTGDFGHPGDVDRKIVVTLVHDGAVVYGPYTIKVPAEQ